ncbi:MAG: hypothetical protein K2Q10_13855, partial [Rhodospirillales bacterium]|nr:hypothetical protein [Rhodospirillales bacterium]
FDAITFEDDGAEEEEPVPQPSGSESIDPHPDNVCVEIHHLDVAQGDSTLILVRDAGSVIYSALVDGGKKGRAEMIHNYMAKVGIISLDVMVVTHFDQDHALGAFHLLALSPLCNHTLLVDRGEILDKDREKLRDKSLLGETNASNKNEDFSVEFESDLHEFNQWWRPRSTKRTMLSGDDALGRYIFDISGPGFVISLQCIAVNGNVLGDRYVQPMHSDRENGMSLCLLLRFNEFYYFLGGDAPGVSGNNLEGAVADGLMDDLELDHVCGLKVSHHGSAQSTSASFIGKIKPTCAFISCGTEFCFPRPQVLANLLNQKTIQNIYLSRCIFQREGITTHNKIQTGTARVAGDENTMGTIVLRMDASMADNHIFHVGYWDREQGAWKSIRHCCGYKNLNEEIVNAQPEDYEDDEMLITPCRKQDIQEETKEDEAEEENSEENEAEPDLIEMLDATERLRAAKDCENVRSIGVNAREAMRSTELDDEKRSSKQQQESKTIETQEMIDELDNEYEIEMDQKEKEEYEDDEEYTE